MNYNSNDLMNGIAKVNLEYCAIKIKEVTTIDGLVDSVSRMLSGKLTDKPTITAEFISEDGAKRFYNLNLPTGTVKLTVEEIDDKLQVYINTIVPIQ